MIARTLWSFRVKNGFFAVLPVTGALYMPAFIAMPCRFSSSYLKPGDFTQGSTALLFRQSNGTLRELSRIPLFPTRQSHQRFCVAEG